MLKKRSGQSHDRASTRKHDRVVCCQQDRVGGPCMSLRIATVVRRDVQKITRQHYHEQFSTLFICNHKMLTPHQTCDLCLLPNALSHRTTRFWDGNLFGSHFFLCPYIFWSLFFLWFVLFNIRIFSYIHFLICVLLPFFSYIHLSYHLTCDLSSPYFRFCKVLPKEHNWDEKQSLVLAEWRTLRKSF